MRRYVICALSLIVLISLSADFAVASKELTIRRLGDVNSTTFKWPGPTARQMCQVGNGNPLAWVIPDFITPPEQYKLVFDPKLTCEECFIGIEIDLVRVVLQFEEACNITMSVDIEEVSYLPGEPDCPRPGESWCNSGVFVVEISEAGVWDIGLPIDCSCLTDERLYCIGVTFDDVSCLTGTIPGLVTDDSPTVCTNWNNYGAGWDDLTVEYPGWPGNLAFYADADCCSVPLPVDERTWGHIKSLYDG